MVGEENGGPNYDHTSTLVNPSINVRDSQGDPFTVYSSVYRDPSHPLGLQFKYSVYHKRLKVEKSRVGIVWVMEFGTGRDFGEDGGTSIVRKKGDYYYLRPICT